MSLKAGWNVVKATVREFGQDQAQTLGAALAYYAIFSIAPLLVIAVGVAGLVIRQSAAQQQIMQQLQAAVGERAASVIGSMMASQTRSGSLIATIAGVVVLLLGASGMFSQLKTSLNQIWRVRPRADRGVLGLVFDRLAALLMVLAIGVLLLASMLLTTFISAFYDQISDLISLPGFVAQLVNLGVSLAILTLLFALIFKILPDVRVAWRSIWIGAFGTAVLFLAGEYLLSLYLGRQGAASPYGAAGSVVLILMWVYYSALILFVGAVFTHVYAQHTGSRIEPGKYAELVSAPAGN
jgi:membrane protein